MRYDVASSDTLQPPVRCRRFAQHSTEHRRDRREAGSRDRNRRPQFGFRLAYGRGRTRAGSASYGTGSTDIVSVVPANASLPPQRRCNPAAGGSVPTPVTTGDANRGANIAQANGCAGCHGAAWRGGLGPALYGIEHRLSFAAIADHIKNPTAPMPNFGFTQAQIADIVTYLSSPRRWTQ